MAGDLTPQLPQEVHVVDSDGNIGTMDVASAREAIKAGVYRPASAQDLQNLSDQQTFGEGAGSALKAFGAGAARSATFGLSDQFLTGSGLTSPETLSKLKEHRPGASLAGEVAGIAGMLAAPEVEGLGLLGEAANPVRAVSKIGHAATEAAVPLAERAAGAVAGAETSPIVNKIVSKAISMGAGSAVEGAAYGLGQAVSEDALGNPEALGDKLLSHVGYGALLGGTLGGAVGGIAGAATGVTQKYLPKFLMPADKAALEAGDLSASIRTSDLPEAEKKQFFKGLTETKENAKEIIEAGAEIGAPVLESQTSASKVVQDLDSALINNKAPTSAVLRRKELVDQGYKAVNRVVNDSVGAESALSAAETGDLLKKAVSEKIEQEYAPLKELYKEIEPYQEAIPLTDKNMGPLSRNINKIIEEQRLIEGTARYNFVKNVADSIDQVKDLAWLKNFRTEVSKSAPMEAKDLARAINEKLNGVEERAIKKFAQTMKSSQAKEKIMALLDQLDQAKEGYKALRSKMEELGKVLGKKTIRGPQDFLDHLDEMTPEKFLKKAFAKDNSEFLKFFQKNFPEETEFLMRYQRGEMARAAMADGKIDPKKLFKQIDALSPELKNIMFKPEELKKLQAARTWVEALPKDINPSGTDHTRAARDYFEGAGAGAAIGMGIAGPAGAIPGAILGAAGKKVLAEVRDHGIEAFVKAAGRIDPEGATKVAGLASLERTSQKQTQAIASGAKAIFKTAQKAALPASAVIGFAVAAKDDHKDIIKKIDQLQASPEHFIDHLDAQTSALYQIAPKTAGAVQQTAIRATQFLHDKAPRTQQAGPLQRKLPPSQAEITKFKQYYDTVQNPVGVLKNVAAGFVTPEQIETLGNVYPTLFAEMKSTVLEHLMEHMANPGFELPYKKRSALAMFLGQDLDGSLSPQAIQTNQMAMNQLGAQQAKQDMMTQAKVSQTGMGKINAAGRMLTAMQTTAQRENA
jgi:hypothetical protein